MIEGASQVNRTFHDNAHELHGVTVVVDSCGLNAYIGRCHDVTDDEVVLLDADDLASTPRDMSKRAWIKRAAKVGVFGRQSVLRVPRTEVASITPLGQIDPD